MNLPLLKKLIGTFYRKEFKTLIYWFIICFTVVALADFLLSNQEGIGNVTRNVVAAL